MCLSRAETWFVLLTSVQGTQNNSIQPGSDLFPYSMGRQTSQKSLFRHLILPHFAPLAATYMSKPGWNLIGFIDRRSGDSARLQPIPIFYGTPNFSIIIVQTSNSSPFWTSGRPHICLSRAETWLILLTSAPGDPTQFDPAWLRSIPIFYGTPNFPIIIVFWTSKAAKHVFEPGWILIGFIVKRPGDPKQLDPAWLRPIPIFYGTPNFPIYNTAELNLTSLGGYIYVWAGLNPDWINLLASIQGIQNNSIQPGSDPFPFSMERQISLLSLLKH